MPALKSIPKLGPWRLKAACTEHDSSLWFPELGETTEPFALMVCQECPVLTECRDYALSHETYGVWGGMSPTDLPQARRRLTWGRVTISPRCTGNGWDAKLVCEQCDTTESVPVAGTVDGRAPSLRVVAKHARAHSWAAAFTPQGRIVLHCPSCRGSL